MDEGEEKPTSSTSPVFEWNPCPSSAINFLGLVPLTQFGDYEQHETPGKIKVSTCHRRARRNSGSVMAQIALQKRDDKLLHKAVDKGEESTARQLLQGGADPSWADSRQRSSLHIAAARGDTQLVSLLLSFGADRNKRDSIGNTPLHLAACTSHIPVVTLLLRAGADVNCLDNTGRTPVHLATGRLRMLKSGRTFSNDQLKKEVTHIIDMMREYLTKSKTDTSQLDNFQFRLNETQSRDAIDEVNDLLADFAGLQLTKNEVTKSDVT